MTKTIYVVTALLDNAIQKIQCFENKEEAEKVYVEYCKYWYNDNALDECFGKLKLSKEEYDSYVGSSIYNNMESALVEINEVILQR